MTVRWVVALLALLVSLSPLHAAVELPAIFGDNMVLQEGDKTRMWGRADAGEKVTLAFGSQELTTTADDRGRFCVTLPPLAVGPLGEIRIKASNQIVLRNVLVGDVWMGSGQSNMEWPLRSYDGRLEAAKADHPEIRIFRVKKVIATTPQEDLEGCWEVCTPKTAELLSGVLYYFGRDLHRELRRPIGLIHCAWGGTIIQCWSRLDSLMTDEEAGKAAHLSIRQYDDPVWCENSYQRQIENFEAQKARLKDDLAAIRKLRVPVRPSPLATYRPGGIYNAMVAPLAGLSLRGIVWYQGEFNAGQAKLYGRLLPLMISDWRRVWNRGEVPFVVFQLPHFRREEGERPDEREHWAFLREAQLAALTLPRTAVVTTVDLGDGFLHPRDKAPFGARAAQAALKLVYGRPGYPSGPQFRGISVNGSEIRVQFDHVDEGLELRGIPAEGFTLAGEDKKFHPASARLEGDEVVVSSDAVGRPVAVRYAWANEPKWCLYTKDGLAVTPFRSDRW